MVLLLFLLLLLLLLLILLLLLLLLLLLRQAAAIGGVGVRSVSWGFVLFVLFSVASGGDGVVSLGGFLLQGREDRWGLPVFVPQQSPEETAY